MTSNQSQNTYLFSANAVFIEELYDLYLNNPLAVDKSWQDYFANMEAGQPKPKYSSYHRTFPTIIGIKSHEAPAAAVTKGIAAGSDLVTKARLFVTHYRKFGHYLSQLDPLEMEIRKSAEELALTPLHHGFTEAELDSNFELENVICGIKTTNARTLHHILQQTYSHHIALEFDHIDCNAERKFLSDKMEEQFILSPEEKLQTLQNILEVEAFEQFVHTKFPGEKRFSVEGGENSISAVEVLINNAATLGVQEIVIGMPHRGRLDVLTKVVGKPYVAVLSELCGALGHPLEMNIPGDVKYHLGWSSDREVNGSKVHLSLTPNPSHLEAVNPVVSGRVRAKGDLLAKKNGGAIDRSKTMGLLLHGDAAFAGQGVVMESLALSDLEGYHTGGTLHIIVNNQIGFTAVAKEARKGRYATEIAKTIQAPIFHVNGDDAEAVVKVASIAIEYRQKFKKDVIIDVICYRLHGHNEGDEPFFTQPKMYKIIHAHPTPTTIYSQQLIAEGVITLQQVELRKEKFKEFLNLELQSAQNFSLTQPDWLEGDWSFVQKYNMQEEVITGVKASLLQTLGLGLCTTPAEFKLNTKIVRLLEAKKQMIETGENIDWGTGEALAFASILSENIGIRLTGQDCCRGTFSHRHSVLIDQATDARYTPLNNLSLTTSASYEVVNSNLSEYAVLGFEYGYSITDPKSLVIWEAQFGDFANGAQIIIDQFISSAEVKWLRMSGLVMLLPHGYEGQGPEHSSARLERFLQLCAENNMQVVNCSTPASYFHALRRQMVSNHRKPLIVMSPKSLLRHKLAVSKIADMVEGTRFKPVIGDNDYVGDQITKVIICSGKVYYDLFDAREKRELNSVAIIRLEQFYPFPTGVLTTELKQYKNAQFVWCQEEHRNMGGWSFILERMQQVLESLAVNGRITYAGRKESASPAAGYKDMSAAELAELINMAFA